MSELVSDLHSEVERTLHRLREHPRASRVLTGTAPAQVLADYYLTAHETVRYATEYLRRSAAALRRDGGHPDLIALLDRKVAEETGHERWLAEDLAAIGFPLETPSFRPAPAAHLYNVFHRAVVDLRGEAFFGTAWVLESLSLHSAGLAAENLRAHATISGITRDSTAGLTFLTSHHDADVDHVAQLAEVIERCVTETSARDYLRLCARFTASVYPDFFAGTDARPT